MVVLSCVVHDALEHVERRNHAEEVLIQTLPILYSRRSGGYHVVNVAPEICWQVHEVLGGNNQHNAIMTTVKHKLSHLLGHEQRFIESKVVKHDKDITHGSFLGQAFLLCNDGVNHIRTPVTVNIRIRNTTRLLEKTRGLLRAAFEDTHRDVAFVV